MARYEYLQRTYRYDTNVTGTVVTSERWTPAVVYACNVEVTPYGALKFYDEPNVVIAAEPPHAWRELRSDR